MELETILNQYFSENKLMQLATIADGQPWLCNVYFVVDEENNIYWTSAKRRRHSKEIMNNPAAAVTIVHDQDTKQAVQITGNAQIVPLEDVERVNKLYGDKFGDKPSRLAEVLENTADGRAYWVLTPTKISLWDEVHFSDEPKQEYL